MKKFIVSITGLLAGLILLPMSVSAAPATTSISGAITNNGSPVFHAKVTVTCNGHVKHVSSNNVGGYLANFKAANCPNGSHVIVSATKKGTGGSSSGTVAALTSKLNVSVINVSVPELGTVVGISAAVLGAGSFLIIRRRQLGAH